MKKFILLGAIFFGILMTEKGYSQNSTCCPPVVQEKACQEVDTGEGWCLMQRNEPVYTNEWKCHEENVYSQRKCCRYVKQPYEVKRCRYVPQYYTETCYRYEPEYYYVTDCKPCKKWQSEKKCTLVPKYYWKHVSGQEAPASSAHATPPAAPRGK